MVLTIGDLTICSKKQAFYAQGKASCISLELIMLKYMTYEMTHIKNMTYMICLYTWYIVSIYSTLYMLYITFYKLSTAAAVYA